MPDTGKDSHQLSPCISEKAAWAFSLGTAIGWGSLVITSSTYLAQAGPVGSTLGLLIGAAVMILIAGNYHYMMNVCPESGGAYAYARDAFGYDHGFLTAWFLALTYLAIFWANATSLPLFARFFIGDIFKFGKMYSLFGYDVFLGEALFTIAAVWAAAIFTAKLRRPIPVLMTVMAVFFSVGILICAVYSLLRFHHPLEMAFIPDKDAFSQVIRIAVISPWAFIGFENISHMTEEFTFTRKKAFRILVGAVISATVLYIAVTLLSVTAFPQQYGNWLDYIRDRGNLAGIEGLPAFYAARHYLGSFGVGVLMLALLCLILTSLIGNMFALSRLLYAVARDDILPDRFRTLNAKRNPENAILLVACVSTLVPFLGRTAVGWIVDVTSIGATIVYALVSASAWKTALFRHDRKEMYAGISGTFIMTAFLTYLLLPNLFTSGTMERESYFLFVAWSVIGFVFFRIVLGRDREKHFGRSIIVWIGLLSLVLFVSLVWMSQASMQATEDAMEKIQEFYRTAGYSGDNSIIMIELAEIRQANAGSILIVVGLFALSLGVLLNSYSIMNKRALESERELGYIRDMANTDPLTHVKSKHAYAEYEEKMNRSIKEQSQPPFAVLMCDVNGLKYINDTYGHKAGDAYIVSAAKLICDLYEHSPVFRVGGDEFVVILSGRDFDRRDEILADLNRIVTANVGTDEVVISAGMSDFDAKCDVDMHAPLVRADAAMYERKKALKAMGARIRS